MFHIWPGTKKVHSSLNVLSVQSRGGCWALNGDGGRRGWGEFAAALRPVRMPRRWWKCCPGGTAAGQSHYECRPPPICNAIVCWSLATNFSLALFIVRWPQKFTLIVLWFMLTTLPWHRWGLEVENHCHFYEICRGKICARREARTWANMRKCAQHVSPPEVCCNW
jgi:hypothetical protein